MKGNRVLATLSAAAAAVGMVIVGPTSLANASPVEVNRVAGNNTFDTSARIASAYGRANAIIVANGDASKDGVDALAANYLAGARHAPIILTTTGSIGATQIEAIKKVLAGAKSPKVYVIGKTDSVSAVVLDKILAAVPGASSTRIAGNNRYETAAAILKAAGIAAAKIGISGRALATTAILASGEVNADALAAGALSAAWGIPVVLTQSKAGLPAASLAAFKAAGVKQLIVLGKTDRVPEAALAAAKAAGITAMVRVGESNRFATSASLYNQATSNWKNASGQNYGAVFSGGTAFLVNGITGFAEALAGGPLAGLTESVIVTTSGKNIDPKVAQLLSQLGASRVTVLGDATGVPNAVANSAVNSVSNGSDNGGGTIPDGTDPGAGGGSLPPAGGAGGGGSAPPPPPAPIITYTTYIQVYVTPYTSTTTNDPNLDSGLTTKDPGIDGVTQVTFKQTYVDGVASGDPVEDSRLVTSVMVPEVIHVGTRVVDPSVSYRTYTVDSNVIDYTTISTNTVVYTTALGPGVTQSDGGSDGRTVTTYQQKQVDGLDTADAPVVIKVETFAPVNRFQAGVPANDIHNLAGSTWTYDADFAQQVAQLGVDYRTNTLGKSAWTPLNSSGVRLDLPAEEHAWGFTDAQALMNAWIASPEHQLGFTTNLPFTTFTCGSWTSAEGTDQERHATYCNRG